MSNLIVLLIVFFSAYCLALMLYKLRQEAKTRLPLKQKVQLSLTGMIAFFCDTIGIGSFAINIALGKHFKLFKDLQLPAVANGAQVLPGSLEAFFFLQIVYVDPTTLLSLIIATCLGGVLGAYLISHLKQQHIRLTMVVCFIGVATLLMGSEMHWFKLGGEANALHGWKLLWGVIGLFICGALTSAGIGLFAMVQAVLFLLNISPLVAFPIMTTAGALQQPLTTIVFVKKNKIPLKKTLIISLAGLLGLLMALPFMASLSQSQLHWLLIAVLTYNTINLASAYLKDNKREASDILSPLSQE